MDKSVLVLMVVFFLFTGKVQASDKGSVTCKVWNAGQVSEAILDSVATVELDNGKYNLELFHSFGKIGVELYKSSDLSTPVIAASAGSNKNGLTLRLREPELSLVCR